ncbi:MAG: hypothetical protein U0324_19055 [Polyangiales bacterium]
MPPPTAEPERSPLAEPARAALIALARCPPAADDALAAVVLDLAFARFAASRGLRVDASRAPLVASVRSADAAFDGVDFASLDIEHLGAAHEALLGLAPSRAGGAVALVATDARRRAGAHYTARPLAEAVVRDTLAPLLADASTAEAVLDVAVCDPAMGAGAFLLEACRQLAEVLARAWARSARPPDVAPADVALAARRAVAARCLHGVDQDARAVAVARRSLWIECRAGGDPDAFLGDALRVGDALVGDVRGGPRERAAAERAATDIGREEGRAVRCVHWAGAFEAAFARGGFAAVVGNPPWVSYAGRAAQPLAVARRRWYDATFTAFARYKNLQGLFVERAASLLRPGGRLGLVLPSSMAELDGYGPTRAAHHRLAACDPSLPDLGERGFAGVFQPSMVLRSTARATPVVGDPAAWPIERPDLDAEARALLEKLSGPPLPPSLFGERGLHTLGDDVAHLRGARDEVHTVPLRVGSDVTAFRRGSPSAWADPAWFGARLRGADEWAAVDVLIRQTARVPIAARGDGVGFRNSLLAGFGSEAYPAGFLVAYLNAAPVRWWHFHRHRDARLGMPQVKVGHLRAIPAPPRTAVTALTALGDAIAARDDGATEAEQRAIDDAVADAFGLTGDERDRVARDAARWR